LYQKGQHRFLKSAYLAAIDKHGWCGDGSERGIASLGLHIFAYSGIATGAEREVLERDADLVAKFLVNIFQRRRKGFAGETLETAEHDYLNRGVGRADARRIATGYYSGASGRTFEKRTRRTL